jgi:hypothetical protein
MSLLEKAERALEAERQQKCIDNTERIRYAFLDMFGEAPDAVNPAAMVAEKDGIQLRLSSWREQTGCSVISFSGGRIRTRKLTHCTWNVVLACPHCGEYVVTLVSVRSLTDLAVGMRRVNEFRNEKLAEHAVLFGCNKKERGNARS